MAFCKGATQEYEAMPLQDTFSLYISVNQNQKSKIVLNEIKDPRHFSIASFQTFLSVSLSQTHPHIHSHICLFSLRGNWRDILITGRGLVYDLYFIAINGVVDFSCYTAWTLLFLLQVRAGIILLPCWDVLFQLCLQMSTLDKETSLYYEELYFWLLLKLIKDSPTNQQMTWYRCYLC